MRKLTFEAKVKLGANLDAVVVPFAVETKDGEDETNLLWDEVFDAAVDAVEEKFPESDFPKQEITEMSIVTDEGKFPVVDESQDLDDFRKDYDFEGEPKILVLPFAHYSLVPEFKAYLDMKEAGLVDFEYDLEKMRKLLEFARKLT